MPQIPVAGAMVSSEADDQGEIFRFFPGDENFAVTGFPGGADLAIHLAGPRNDLTTQAVQTAPTVTSATISGTTAMTGTLTATIVAQGNPLPSPELIQWTKGGVDIADATGPSWDKTGLSAGDVIGYRYVVANGVLPKATGTASNPVTITAQPTITAEYSPVPLVAGQPGEIEFNVAPDTVTGNVIFTRIGTTNGWSFVAPDDPEINVSGGATLAGYASLPFSYDVVAPDPVPVTPQFVAVAGGFEIINADEDTSAIPYEGILPVEYAGEVRISPDVIYGTAGAQWLWQPDAILDSDTLVLTMQDGLPAMDKARGPWTRARRWRRGATAETSTIIPGATGASYTATDDDRGLNVYPVNVAIAANAVEVAGIGDGVAVPALPVSAGWWDPLVDTYPGSFAADLATGQVRYNGTTYASLAAARTAGVLVVNANGSDTRAIAPGTSMTLVAHGVYGAAGNDGRYLFCLDDGADGELSDHLVPVFQGSVGGSSYKIQSGAWTGGSKRVGLVPAVSGASGEAFHFACRVKSGGTLVAQNGVAGTSSAFVFTLPTLTTLVLENSSLGDKAWIGPKGQVTFINGDLDDATVVALSAAPGA